MGWIPNIEMIKMPLPDTNNWSSRIYELLKETDLENLSYAQFQAVAEKLFIEPENEDEMRRLVLVQLARMAVRGDWDGFLSGGSGGAPTNADYLLAYDQGTVPSELTNARKLVVGNNISMAHGAGDNDDMTISATPGGSDGQIQYNVAGVLAATGLLSTNKTNTFTLVATSGDGQIDISSSTKAVSLLCDENQKLKVKGSSDSFVLDVSSATGGITFPDGTTQSTAASGSGTSKYAPVMPATDIDSGAHKLYLVSRMGIWGARGSGGGTFNGSTQPYFFPFQSPKTGDIDHISINVASDGTGVYGFAIYSDNQGVPDSQIGGSMSYTGGTGGTGREDLTPASTISLTQGVQYWIGVVETTSGNTSLSAESNSSVCQAGPISANTSNLATINQGASLIQGTASSSLPSSVTASDLQVNFQASIRWGIVYA